MVLPGSRKQGSIYFRERRMACLTVTLALLVSAQLAHSLGSEVRRLCGLEVMLTKVSACWPLSWDRRILVQHWWHSHAVSNARSAAGQWRQHKLQSHLAQIAEAARSSSGGRWVDCVLPSWLNSGQLCSA